MTEEIEVKFYTTDLPAVRAMLLALGARITAPRVFEANLRFDTPARELTAAKKVLRLRKDTRARLTVKTQGKLENGVMVRPEYEVEVSDFAKTRQILEALGYEAYSLYEKYRETLELDGLEFMLDELPYGNFVELEGKSTELINQLARKVGLKPENRAVLSYMDLFENLRKTKKLAFTDLSFENFKGIKISFKDFNLPKGKAI